MAAVHGTDANDGALPERVAGLPVKVRIWRKVYAVSVDIPRQFDVAVDKEGYFVSDGQIAEAMNRFPRLLIRVTDEEGRGYVGLGERLCELFLKIAGESRRNG